MPERLARIGRDGRLILELPASRVLARIDLRSLQAVLQVAGAGSAAVVRALDTAVTAAALPGRPGMGAAAPVASPEEGGLRSCGVDLALAVVMVVAGVPGPVA